jgi:hypothetical protein
MSHSAGGFQRRGLEDTVLIAAQIDAARAGITLRTVE